MQGQSLSLPFPLCCRGVWRTLQSFPPQTHVLEHLWLEAHMCWSTYGSRRTCVGAPMASLTKLLGE